MWTIANGISASRIVLLVPLAYCLFAEFAGNRLWALGILAVGIVTDFLDGYLARRFHEVSELGKIIDPLADKIAVGAVAAFLVILDDISPWYLAGVLARDALILMGGMYIRRKKNIIAQSNWPGKVAVNFIALYLLLSVAKVENLEVLQEVSLWASVGMMIVSLAVYGQRLFIGRSVGRSA